MANVGKYTIHGSYGIRTEIVVKESTINFPTVPQFTTFLWIFFGDLGFWRFSGEILEFIGCNCVIYPSIGIPVKILVRISRIYI